MLPLSRNCGSIRKVFNKVIYFFVTIVIIVFSSRCHNSDYDPSYKVKYYGALKNIMHKGDLSANFKLSQLDSFENIYALGAIENLKGEVQIFNDSVYNSFVIGDSLIIDQSLDKDATLLIFSEVKEWKSISIPDFVKTESDFQEYLIAESTKNGVNVNAPFPFLVEGTFNLINWHVINWKEGDKQHSHEKHIHSGLHGELNNIQASFLGFYSNSHHSIFTHHTTNMHIHMKTNSDGIAGHVDNFLLGEKMILKLPKSI